VNPLCVDERPTSTGMGDADAAAYYYYPCKFGEDWSGECWDNFADRDH